METYENEDELMEAVERAYEEEMLGPDEDIREVLERCLDLETDRKHLERCLDLETDEERLERMLDLELEDYE
ncbi:hypothetical protein KA344_07565 [bacterium]|nr:hypothetical protein [bacterium]